MKRFVLLFIAIAFHINAWALGGYASLSGDGKKVTDVIKDTLALTEDDAYQIFDNYLKGYLDTKDWSYNKFDNDTISTNKISKSPNKTIYLNFVSDNRFTNISVVKFSVEKQVIIHTIETLPRNSQTVIDKYNETKRDSAYKADVDKAEFSSFTRTGYTSRQKFVLNSGIGGIQYVDMFIYDLKK